MLREKDEYEVIKIIERTAVENCNVFSHDCVDGTRNICRHASKYLALYFSTETFTTCISDIEFGVLIFV
jgi:hypothetical protein